MKSSYTKSIIPHLLRLNLFFLLLVLLNGCQIDQSVSLIKEKLFSDDENIPNVDKESEKINNDKSDREIKTSKKSEKHKRAKIKEDVEKNIEVKKGT